MWSSLAARPRHLGQAGDGIGNAVVMFECRTTHDQVEGSSAGEARNVEVAADRIAEFAGVGHGCDHTRPLPVRLGTVGEAIEQQLIECEILVASEVEHVDGVIGPRPHGEEQHAIAARRAGTELYTSRPRRSNPGRMKRRNEPKMSSR